MNACKRTLVPALFSLLLAQPIFAVSSISPGFASGEHVVIGDQIKLRFSDNDNGTTKTIFHLSNGLDVSYGDLLTLADFYGLVDAPVSDGKTSAERRYRFINAFSTLAYNPNATLEAPKLLDVIYGEIKAVEAGAKNGESPESIYDKINDENNRQYNCITGGGCSPNNWWLNPGRYLNLMNSNFDHFDQSALLAYQAGHQVALEQAALAHRYNDRQQLEFAYELNAFATHFLTDRFSAGHIRVPRHALSDNVTPATVGSLLAGYMHDEESQFGLHVSNARGDHWIAYGDKSYFSKQTEAHRQIILEAAQNSVDEVFEAYQTGSAIVTDRVTPLLPWADEEKNAANVDISTLFYWDSITNTVLRRTTTADYFDRNWTGNWWGWSTLLQLRNERGISKTAQGLLANSEVAKQAVADGLITDKVTIEYVNRK